MYGLVCVAQGGKIWFLLIEEGRFMIAEKLVKLFVFHNGTSVSIGYIWYSGC